MKKRYLLLFLLSFPLLSCDPPKKREPLSAELKTYKAEMTSLLPDVRYSVEKDSMGIALCLTSPNADTSISAALFEAKGDNRLKIVGKDGITYSFDSSKIAYTNKGKIYVYFSMPKDAPSGRYHLEGPLKVGLAQADVLKIVPITQFLLHPYTALGQTIQMDVRITKDDGTKYIFSCPDGPTLPLRDILSGVKYKREGWKEETTVGLSREQKESSFTVRSPLPSETDWLINYSYEVIPFKVTVGIPFDYIKEEH